MKRASTVGFLLLCTSLAAGCWAKDGATAANEHERPDSAAAQERDAAKDEAAAETKEAAQAVADYAYAQKAELVAGMKEDLAAIERELDLLAAKVARSSGEAKVRAELELAAVRDKWAKTNEKLAAVERASESEWDGVKGDFRQAYRDMKGSFDQTRQWLSDEIEP
jgi:hypothetical protein